MTSCVRMILVWHDARFYRIEDTHAKCGSGSAHTQQIIENPVTLIVAIIRWKKGTVLQNSHGMVLMYFVSLASIQREMETMSI